MSAISWRQQGARRSAPSQQTLASPHARALLLGLACAGLLLAPPHPLTWTALVLGVPLAAWAVVCGEARLSGPVAAGLTLFAVGLGLGATAAGLTEPAVARLSGYVGTIVLLATLGSIARTPVRLQIVTAGVVGCVFVGELIVLALLRGGLPSSPFTRLLQPVTRFFAAFPGVSGDTLEVNALFSVHHYGLAHLALVAAPFGVALALGKTSTGWRVAGLLWALAQVVLLLATQSRGAVLALAVVVALIGSVRTRWAWAVVPVGAAVLGALIARGTLSRQIEADWLSLRLSIWGRTMSMLGDFPITGIGLGARTYAETFAWYFELPNPYEVSHTHNIVLQAYAEQGLLGALGLVGIMAGGGVLAVRAIRASASPSWVAAAGAGGAFLGSALYGLTDQVVSSNLSLALVFALLAIASAAVHPARAADGAQALPRLVQGHGDPDRSDTTYRQHRDRVMAAPSRGAILVAGIGLAAVLLGLSLGTRWASGLALNAGTLDLAHAVASPGLTGEPRRLLLERAESWLQQAVALNTRNVAAWRNLGWARMNRNDIPGAHNALDQAAAAPGLTEFERYELGRLYYQLGFTDQAIEQWREAGDRARLQEVAAALTGRGRWRETVAAHAALLSLEPDNSDHMANLAVAVLNSGGDVNEALAWLATATERNPESARSLARQLVLRGEPYRVNERRGGGDAQKAIFWFSLASRVDPTYDRPEVELGAVLLYRDRLTEAEEHFRAALARDDTDSSTWNWVAQVLERQDRLMESIGFYREAARRGPDRGVLHANLARALARAGFTEEARLEYREAVRLDPSDQRSREELGALGASPVVPD